MQLAMNSFQYVWYADGKPVDAICIFDKTGELLTVNRGWLSSVSGAEGQYRHYREIQSIDEIADIRNRRTVDFSREEHFVVNKKGHRTLYLCAGLFGGYSTVDTVRAYEYDTHYSLIKQIQIRMSVNGGEQQWHTIWAAHTEGEEDKECRPLVQAIQAKYNASVADHPNRHISETQAARLLDLLPELWALRNGSL